MKFDVSNFLFMRQLFVIAVKHVSFTDHNFIKNKLLEVIVFTIKTFLQ